MYLIRAHDKDSLLFEAVTDQYGFMGLVHVISLNKSVEFKVFYSGSQIMPRHIGWGDFPGWVERFKHEKEQ